MNEFLRHTKTISHNVFHKAQTAASDKQMKATESGTFHKHVHRVSLLNVYLFICICELHECLKERIISTVICHLKTTTAFTTTYMIVSLDFLALLFN